MEGAKYRSFGGMGRLRMVYAINEQRKAKDIREKYELLGDMMISVEVACFLNRQAHCQGK